MLFHRIISIGAVMGALLIEATFASVPQSHVIRHEKRTFSPDAWTRKSAAPQDTIVPLRITLASRNEDIGHEHLMDISDPTSPNFGKHWTPQQVASFFAPGTATVRSVQNWLSAAGLARSRQRVASDRGSVSINATVSEAESLLKTKYYVWENNDSQVSSISCDEYYVPKSLQQHISFISPTVNLHSPYPSADRRQYKRAVGSTKEPHRPIRIKAKEGDDDSPCSETVSPACIKQLYGIPDPTTAVRDNELGIFECGDTYDQPSLDGFFTEFASNIPNGTHPILQSIDGGTAPTGEEWSGGESALDFDIAFPLLYPQAIKLYQTFPTELGDDSSYSFFDSFLDALDSSYCGGDDPEYDPPFPDQYYNGTTQCGTYTPTNVISVSYAFAEATYTAAYTKRICSEYMKLGLMGTSIIYASGDNGTLSRAGISGCLANGGQNPSFPATCPYGMSLFPGYVLHPSR